MPKHILYDELLDKIENDIKETPFYRIPALNYICTVTDDTKDRSASEIIAKWLCFKASSNDDCKELLLKHSSLQDEEEFSDGSIHNADDIEYNDNPVRNEENIAKRLFQQGNLETETGDIIKVADYQVPVNRVVHSSEGKVDLVLADSRNVIVGELKDEDSKETLLKATAEIKTYQYKIQENKSSLERFMKNYAKTPSDNENWIQPAVIMFQDERSQIWKDFDNAKSNPESTVAHLLRKWDIKFYILESYSLDITPYSDRNYRIRQVWI